MNRCWVNNVSKNRTALAKTAVCIVAFLLCVAVMLICVYVIIPSIISNAADKLEQTIAKQMYESTLVIRPDDAVKPALIQTEGGLNKTALKPRSCFAAALEDNPDIVGRLSMDAAGIYYLVVQSNDNALYLKTGYSGNESRCGAVFMDYRCNADTSPLSGNYILYAHNMKNGTMFHDLIKYKDAGFFYANRFFRFDTLYHDYTWEIFSAYVTDTDFYYIDTEFSDNIEWMDFLHDIQSKSKFQTNAILLEDEVVLTLSTCSYEFEDARFVIHARLVK